MSLCNVIVDIGSMVLIKVKYLIIWLRVFQFTEAVPMSLPFWVEVVLRFGPEKDGTGSEDKIWSLIGLRSTYNPLYLFVKRFQSPSWGQCVYVVMVTRGSTKSFPWTDLGSRRNPVEIVFFVTRWVWIVREHKEQDDKRMPPLSSD